MKPLDHKAFISAFCLLVVSHALVFAQSTTEADALATIKLATNPTTKLAAAEDFIAKFPKSQARVSIAETIAAEILKIKDGAVALALLERAQAVFTAEPEREILKPAALEAYVSGNRADDAFALARDMLAKNPDDIRVLTRLTSAGAEEARKRNRKYADVSLQYGLKAIALIEGGNISDEQNRILGQLYQQTAILYLATNNTAEAKARLTKACALSPHDPSNFALLARVMNADYLSQKDAYDAMPEGTTKHEALKALNTLLDSMIETYAHAAGLATGRAEYQTLLQQVIPDLTAYYKYRHNNQSIQGLQQLINRYRLAP